MAPPLGLGKDRQARKDHFTFTSKPGRPRGLCEGWGPRRARSTACQGPRGPTGPCTVTWLPRSCQVLRALSSLPLPPEMAQTNTGSLLSWDTGPVRSQELWLREPWSSCRTPSSWGGSSRSCWSFSQSRGSALGPESLPGPRRRFPRHKSRTEQPLSSSWSHTKCNVSNSDIMISAQLHRCPRLLTARGATAGSPGGPTRTQGRAEHPGVPTGTYLCWRGAGQRQGVWE